MFKIIYLSKNKSVNTLLFMKIKKPELIKKSKLRKLKNYRLITKGSLAKTNLEALYFVGKHLMYV